MGDFFNEATDGFLLLDKDLNILDVNNSHLKIFRMVREEVVGKHLTDLNPSLKESGRLEKYLEVHRTGKPHFFDNVVPHISLGNYHLEIKVFKSGDNLGVIITDVTKLKNTIGELETIIYKSSHDMRTPITSILGLMYLAEDGIGDIDEARQYCKMVRELTEHLDKVLRKLIETTRIRNGEKNIYLIDFNEVTDMVLKKLEPVNGYAEIQFNKTIAFGHKYYNDKSLISCLLENIIENSIKYRNEKTSHSHIDILISPEKAGVKIMISDNGIGIAAHLQKDVFKMFYRATEKATGSGLGLYTVDHIVRKLNGNIQLESAENQGTTIIVWLPDENVSPVSRIL